MGNYGINGNMGSNLENDLVIIFDFVNWSGYVVDDVGGLCMMVEVFWYDGL